MVELKESDIACFWSKVEKRGADECWIWTGPLNPKGYGTFHYDGRRHPAHRVALALSDPLVQALRSMAKEGRGNG